MHAELITRSLPLMRFYNKMGEITSEKLIWLWKLAQEKHATFQTSIMKIISELVKYFDYDKMKLLYSLLKDLQINQIDNNVLLMIEEMSKNTDLFPKKYRT